MASMFNVNTAQTIIFRNQSMQLSLVHISSLFLRLLSATEHAQKPRLGALTTVTAARRKERNGCLERVKSICLLLIN